MSIFEQFGRKVTGMANLVQKKTTDSIDIFKLRQQIRTAEAERERLFTAIGKTVYDASVTGVQPDVNGMIDTINALNEGIAALNKQIDELSPVRRCVECGRELNSDARFCPYCGAKNEIVVEQKDDAAEVCPKCGAARSGDDRFCASCGYDFSEPNTTAPVEGDDTEKPAE